MAMGRGEGWVDGQGRGGVERWTGEGWKGRRRWMGVGAGCILFQLIRIRYSTRWDWGCA